MLCVSNEMRFKGNRERGWLIWSGDKGKDGLMELKLTKVFEFAE